MNILKVCVINTGGTISCTGNPLVPMSAQNFATACKRLLNPILKQQFPNVEVTYSTELKFDSPTGTLDSTNLQPSDWCLIAEEILKHYESYNAWVVLHGTDTMAYTASTLPFLLSDVSKKGYITIALDKSVILTGSQVPMFSGNPKTPEELTLRYNTDAYQNVCGAIAAAISGIPEVCLYFDGDLYRGNRSVKSNTNEFKAFSSPNYPALGKCGIDFRVYPDRILTTPYVSQTTLSDKSSCASVLRKVGEIKKNVNDLPVLQLNAFPTWYKTAKGNDSSSALMASLIQEWFKDSPTPRFIRGLILESYGEGNFPSGASNNPKDGAVYQALAEAKEKQVIIVDCTQVLQGVVNDSAYGSGTWLPEVGALNPQDMTPITALAKLTILSSRAAIDGWYYEDLTRVFQLNLLGEMLSTSRLECRTNSTLLPGQKIKALDGSAYLENDPQMGPVLKGSDAVILWSPYVAGDLPANFASEMPGHLVLQYNGTLVYYGRTGTLLWQLKTPNQPEGTSMLVLEGSLSDKNIKLSITNYRRQEIVNTIFYQG
ncbi:MAG: asparaginase [Calothrix sp. MO_167.B12]|nr:asparaginase [Calothrix sp. MO_167.B12]